MLTNGRCTIDVYQFNRFILTQHLLEKKTNVKCTAIVCA